MRAHMLKKRHTKKKNPKSERNLKQNTSFHIYTYKKKKVIYLEKHIDFLHSSLTTQNTPIPIKTLIITNTNN